MQAVRAPNIRSALANSALEEVLQRNGGSAGAGVVEENIQAPEGFPSLGEQRPDGTRIGDVGGDREHPAARRGGRGGGPLECFGAPAGKHYRISRGLKRQGDGASDSAAGAGYQRDLANVRHIVTPLSPGTRTSRGRRSRWACAARQAGRALPRNANRPAAESKM